ncbi:MAG: hypothetical protein GY870_10835 [archaeon]|nr:hypothetical protein [archaeon]
MNHSSEEIYLLVGQYDNFVSLEFNYSSEESKKFGLRLMGTFIYTLEERKELENIINKPNFPRTEKKIKFKPSVLEKLNEKLKTELDREGILCSSINKMYPGALRNTNRFRKTGEKDLQNISYINAPSMDGWKEMNRVQFGFLNNRYSSGQPLAPFELIEYWGLRKRFNIKLDTDDYLDMINSADNLFINKIRLSELKAKLNETLIEKEEIKEYDKLVVKELIYKNKIIDAEIKKSTEQFNTISERYDTELEKLRESCRRFRGKILLFGKKLIYLDYERFVHIYTRHVKETQVGERFTDDKTIFQYKFDDIITIIGMVISSIEDEIQEHFVSNPTKNFKRLGKRSVYYDGHYYRLEIETNGNLKDFHPYNDDKNTAANKELS